MFSLGAAYDSINLAPLDAVHGQLFTPVYVGKVLHIWLRDADHVEFLGVQQAGGIPAHDFDHAMGQRGCYYSSVLRKVGIEMGVDRRRRLFRKAKTGLAMTVDRSDDI